LTTIAGTAFASVTVTENVTFTGTLDDALETSINSGVTLTTTAAKVSGKTLSGDGALTVQGIDSNTDLSNVNPVGGVTATIATTDLNISTNTKLGNVDNFSLDSGIDVSMTVAQSNKISAAIGSNTVTLTDAGTLTGAVAVEVYTLAAGANTFTTASTAGTTINGNTGVDQVTGGSGNDILNGNDGNDVLSGGLGADSITGGVGFDTMTGGGGVDTFIFASGSVANISNPEEIITDFTTGTDRLNFGGSSADVTVVDGSGMLKSTFKSNASTFFDGNELDVYIAYNVSELGDALVAVDMNSNGTFDDGDIFLKLLGVDGSTDILASDVV
jgi:Ca2+-binding RTX toxin-like protein